MKMQPARSIAFAVLALSGSLIPSLSLGARSQTSEGDGTSVVLRDGTPIHLVLMDDLQGKKLKANQTVHFQVREDLFVNSKLVIRTGAEAIGHVEAVSKNGLLGKSGRLVLHFDYATSASGIKIALKGGTGVSGGKGGALTGVSAMWYGPDASLPVGTIINAYINQDQRITLP